MLNMKRREAREMCCPPPLLTSLFRRFVSVSFIREKKHREHTHTHTQNNILANNRPHKQGDRRRVKKMDDVGGGGRRRNKSRARAHADECVIACGRIVGGG